MDEIPYFQIAQIICLLFLCFWACSFGKRIATLEGSNQIKLAQQHDQENQRLLNDQPLDNNSGNQKNYVNLQIEEKFKYEWEQKKAEFVTQIQEDLKAILQKHKSDTIKAVFSHNDFSENVRCVQSNDLQHQIQQLQEKFQQFQNDQTNITDSINQNSASLPQEIQQQILQHFPQNQQTFQRSIFQNLDEKLQNLKQVILSEALEKEIAQNSLIQNLQIELKNFIQQQEEFREGIKKSTVIQLNEAVQQIANTQQNIHASEQQELVQNIGILKSAERQQHCKELIEQLYNKSWRTRYVPNPELLPFVKRKESQQDLQRYYSIRSTDNKKKLAQFCQKFRQARGDGNCFYSSFGFQFLHILLVKYSDQEFNSTLQQWCDNLEPKLSMKINLKNIKCDDPETEKELLLEFIYRLQQLRQIDIQDREEALVRQYAAYEFQDEVNDGLFYGLSTIFFRNLANKVIDKSEQVSAVYDRQNLLIWEEMCDSNEVIIAALAAELKINVQLLFFQDGSFEARQYGEENYDKIILLIRPGHYNIGIVEEEQQEQQY